MHDDGQRDGPAAAGPSGPHDGDLHLIERVRADGDSPAVEELYRRHHDAALRLARHLSDPVTAEDIVAEAFARVLQALRSGNGPTSAFRPYFLTTVRNVYVTHVRQDSRHVWTADHPEAGLDPLVPDPTAQRADSELLAAAFASLPERWQVVLWHTAVEGEDHATVGRLLGVKANAVAALGFRAREGLRKAYLAAHAAAARSEECRPYVDQLPVYLRGGLGRRQRASLEQHLESCRECSAAYLELGVLNTGLGALLAPVVLGAAAAGYAVPAVPATPGGATALPGGGGGPVSGVVDLLRRPAGAAVAATVLVAALVGAAWAAQPLIGDGDVSRPRASPPPVETTDDEASPSPEEATRVPSGPPTTSPSRRASTPSTATSAPPATAGPESTGPSTPGPGDPTAVPQLSSWSPSVTPPVPPLPTVSPTQPTTAPTEVPVTTEDLALSQGWHAFYSPHHHLEMVVDARVDPTTVTFRIAGLTSFSVHQDRDFVGTQCSATTAAPGDPGVLTCTLAAGSGTFAVDVWVDGPLDASARVSAEHNLDPDPTNDELVFAD